MSECEEILTEGMVLSTVWGKAIVLAERVGRFTPEQKAEAEDWPSCAVGELDPGVTVNAMFEPADDRLRHLGQDFALDVRVDNYRGAARTLVSIKKRTTALVAWGVDMNDGSEIRGRKSCTGS